MEHRYSKRVSADIQALIFKCGMPVLAGRVRNMSRHGVFVQCATEGFAMYQPLEIELFVPGMKALNTSRFKCYLTRKEHIGIALAIFDDCRHRYVEQVFQSAGKQFALSNLQDGSAYR